MIVANNLKSTLAMTKSDEEFKKLLEKKSQITNKLLASTLMRRLTTMKYDGSCTLQEHVLEITTLVVKLKNLGLNVDKYLLVQFTLNSMSFEHYGPFQMNYNTTKGKWNVNELT